MLFFGGIFTKAGRFLEIYDLNKGLPADSVVEAKQSPFHFFPLRLE